MDILHSFRELDKVVFMLINHDADSKFLDPIMMAIREPLTWIPLYVFMLWFSLRKLKHDAVLFIIMTLITFAFTDALCAQLVKPFVGRLRPCYDPELNGMVRSLVDCGGAYSFPSNHAANHFALATYWFFAIRHYLDKKWNWLWIWAAAVCYAQVYVGKHFPSDVLGGAIIGSLVGGVVFQLSLRWQFVYNIKKAS
ncbi:phosphatase PAP2 family protein [Chitinophaga sp.]|uniref:phosphatase PAP2 family protein n=1 Tax=Chitinophaga sp. TaxID=1869181 RepID=UPI0031D2B2BD